MDRPTRQHDKHIEIERGHRFDPEHQRHRACNRVFVDDSRSPSGRSRREEFFRTTPSPEYTSRFALSFSARSETPAHDRAGLANSLERELEYRKKLTGITNQINAAESIPHILMTLKDKILELLDAERLTIYAVDTKNQELYSLTSVDDVPKEIRVPKSFSSIAGFTALARKTINIKDAYDAAELGKFHANLRFDQRWDKQSGFRTKAVLAVPILFEKYLLGVVQLINKRHGVAFTAQDEDAAEEIGTDSRDRVL